MTQHACKIWEKLGVTRGWLEHDPKVVAHTNCGDVGEECVEEFAGVLESFDRTQVEVCANSLGKFGHLQCLYDAAEVMLGDDLLTPRECSKYVEVGMHKCASV